MTGTKDGRKTLLRQRLFRLLRSGDSREAERVRDELRREAGPDVRSGVVRSGGGEVS